MTTSSVTVNVGCDGNVTATVATTARAGQTVQVLEVWGTGHYAAGIKVTVGANVLIDGVRHDADGVTVTVPGACETTTAASTAPTTSTVASTVPQVVEPVVPTATVPTTAPQVSDVQISTAVSITAAPRITGTVQRATLPVTGAPTGPMVGVGIGFLVIGAVMVRMAKGRKGTVRA